MRPCRLNLTSIPACHRSAAARCRLPFVRVGRRQVSSRQFVVSCADIEPSIPVDDVKTLSNIIDQTFANASSERKLLLGGFALVGLILAAVGIYGVMSLHVANRGREFGIRLALGADPRALVRLVLGEGAVLAGLGVVIGIAGAIGATRWLATLLFDVSPTDPVVLVMLPLLLAATALMACYVPARRAAKSDPLAVLRAD